MKSVISVISEIFTPRIILVIFCLVWSTLSLFLLALLQHCSTVPYVASSGEGALGIGWLVLIAIEAELLVTSSDPGLTYNLAVSAPACRSSPRKILPII